MVMDDLIKGAPKSLKIMRGKGILLPKKKKILRSCSWTRLIYQFCLLLLLTSGCWAGTAWCGSSSDPRPLRRSLRCRRCRNRPRCFPYCWRTWPWHPAGAPAHRSGPRSVVRCRHLRIRRSTWTRPRCGARPRSGTPLTRSGSPSRKCETTWGRCCGQTSLSHGWRKIRNRKDCLKIADMTFEKVVQSKPDFGEI